MNEIEKLKTEHARYKKALNEIHHYYSEGQSAHEIAALALNPPPPPPVTLDELKSALSRYDKTNPKYGGHRIAFFGDESGEVHDCVEDQIFSFSTLREAVDWLNR